MNDKIIKRKTKNQSLYNYLSMPIENLLLKDIANILTKQIENELSQDKYASTSAILKLVASGVFLAASIAAPNLPKVLKSFLRNENEYEVWRRFNIPYLKKMLNRLEKQRLIEIKNDKKYQIVEITSAGRKKILRYALDELAIEKPKVWDRTWYLVSYDIPGNLKHIRNVFREYLRAWGFYPYHESMFLHAYPCYKQVEFLREYLGIGKYIRIFKVTEIENDKHFKEFFGI